MMFRIKRVTLKTYYYFIKVKRGAAGFGPNHCSKMGCGVVTAGDSNSDSNNGNPTLGIEPEFTCIKHITTDLYIIDHCLNPNPNPKP